MAATCARFIAIQRQNTPRRHIPTPRKPHASINRSTKVNSFSGSEFVVALNNQPQGGILTRTRSPDTRVGFWGGWGFNNDPRQNNRGYYQRPQGWLW